MSNDPSFLPLFVDVDVSDTTLLVKGLQTGIRHFVRIRAFNENGPGEFSLLRQFVTGGNQLVPPTVLYPAENAVDIPSEFKLTWSRSTAALGYHVQLSYDTSFSPLFVDVDVTDTTLLVKDLKTAIRHFVRIRAFNGTVQESSA